MRILDKKRARIFSDTADLRAQAANSRENSRGNDYSFPRASRPVVGGVGGGMLWFCVLVSGTLARSR
jgi:hypothetical protein